MPTHRAVPDLCLRDHQTAAGGEIDVLDPAGYGTVTITKAISIVNDGAGVAAIGASSSNAITAIMINAGASDSVHLRGLTIEGPSSATNGIWFNTGGNLAIENCVVRNFPFGGILIGPMTTSSTPMSFSVSNTIVSNIGNNGISIAGNGSLLTGVLSNVTTTANNGSGIVVPTFGGSLNVTIVGSEASNNAGVRVAAGASFGNGPTAVMVRNVIASNNGTGLKAEGSGVILRVAHSVATGNGTGVNTSGGGAIQSNGDNDINGNVNDNFGVLTPLAMH